MSKFSDFWDKTVRPFAEDVVLNCKTDLLATHYISQMVFYIEHDLADDRNPIIRLHPTLGTLTSEDYFKNVHENLSTPEEIAKLRKLGQLLKELEKMAIEELPPKVKP